MIKGNKGEWSEIYTLLKVIADRQLCAGDSNLNKIENLIFPIIKVLRDESNGTFEYSYENDLVVVKNNEDEFRIPINEFKENAIILLNKLKEKTNATFSIPVIEAFINSFNSNSIKAKSSIKSDIRIVIHDHRTGTQPELGFSIKSQLGGSSTLLNAGKTTNFVYKVTNVNLIPEQINNINEIHTTRKIKDRVEEIRKLNGHFEFVKVESAVFENNLILIDTALPRIIAEILYLFFTTDISKVHNLVEQVTALNPIGFNKSDNHPFYSYKIKRFLTDIALGMMPSKVWVGELDATGGYLVVKNDGDVLCYHIYNRNKFEEYLYNNTKLETPSSTRHEFGTLYVDNGELFFKLNLQIRFI